MCHRAWCPVQDLGGGRPVIVCPYRDIDAGQPLAIWRGSLVCWLTSYLDCGTHTTTTSLESEDWGFVRYDSKRGILESWSSRLYWVQASHIILLEAKEPQKSVIFKDASKDDREDYKVDDRICNHIADHSSFWSLILSILVFWQNV